VLVLGVYEPSDRDIIRDIGFAPIAADYVEHGYVKTRRAGACEVEKRSAWRGIGF
jgi:hypothetical protein